MKIDFDNYEYKEIVKDILNNREFKKIELCPHHKINRLVHSKRVSYYSYKICKKLGFDYVSAARGGLLHDFFLNKYNTKNSRKLLIKMCIRDRNNCIYLSDDKETIKEKVFSIKTTSRRIDEPGIIDGNILFMYLEAFCEDIHFKKYYSEFNNLDELKIAYQKGGIGDASVKRFLTEVINDELTPIRERRREYAEDLEKVYNILKEGTKKAKKTADKTIVEVKKAMKLNYRCV